MPEFQQDTVQHTLCMPLCGRMIAFDAVNSMGLKGVNAEVKLAEESAGSYFSLEKPKKEDEFDQQGLDNTVPSCYYSSVI